MDKNQRIGLVVAAAVFVFVCVSSYFTNSYAQTQSSLTFIEEILGNTNYSLPQEDFIGIVKVEGEISETASTDYLGNIIGYDHVTLLSLIDDYKFSEYNKGILLYVDSPGGTVYASDELYLKLKEYSDETQRPIWVYMASQACSGGYYISMAADKIYANRNSWTGSIGVIIGLANYEELCNKLGIKEIYYTSGENKSMGASSLPVTEEQDKIFQSLVDESYEQFLNIVSEGRNIDKDTLIPIADGRIYTAQQALDLNLIDGISDYENFLELFSQEFENPVSYYEPDFSTDFFSSFLSSITSLKSSSDLETAERLMKNSRNGVPMYYEFIQK